MSHEIGMDEWLKAVSDAQKSDSAGVTIAELAAQMKCCNIIARKRMRNLIECGKARLCGVKTSYRIDGKPFPAPTYELVKKKK